MGTHIEDNYLEKCEQQITSFENAKYCLLVNSGVSAISVVMQLLKNNSTIIVQEEFYPGTKNLQERIYNKKFSYIPVKPEGHL